jgi:hypothetical protein
MCKYRRLWERLFEKCRKRISRQIFWILNGARRGETFGSYVIYIAPQRIEECCTGVIDPRDTEF